MKKLNYINCIIILVSFITIKSNSESYDKLSGIIEKNLNNIKRINESILSYQQNNNLFNESKNFLQNISHGNELFENEYNYMKKISLNNNKIKDESLYKRLIPETLFHYNENISCFNFISAKTMAKDDTGNFVSILLLICQNNSVIISDLLGNELSVYNTNNIINDIISFKQNDINYFYLISENYTKIKKYFFFYNIYSNNTKNFTINKNTKTKDLINIQTYIEDGFNKTIESFSYELFDLYKQNINSKHFQIIEDENSYFKLNFSDNEYIINISPITIKGSNYLMIVTNKYSVYKLNAKNLDILSYTKIELNYTKKISYNLIPIPMNFCYVLFNKEEKGYFVTKYENSSIIGKCDLFGENETEKIKNYFFEEKSKTIYIISSLNKIYLSIPMLFPSHDSLIKNSCKTVLLSELNKIIENKDNNFDISLLNKKLMITKDGINYEVIDITKIGDVDNNNKLQSKFFELNKYIKNKNNFPPLIMKDNKNYLFVKQINKKDLILFIFYEKNAKIYKTEAPTFNFKVPIILVAFTIILVWNYIKSKNEDTGNDFNKFKNKFD